MINAIKGMNDILPGASEAFLDTAVWERIYQAASDVFAAYGYRRVWLPIVEETTLFARSIGEQTDIVSKEMYCFEDRGGRQMTLRPEGTAGAVRAYIEHHLARNEPVQRWWYAGPMFRAERPQKGRYRQFYQIGAEFFGVASPAADAELLVLLGRLCRRLQLGEITVRINSLGDPQTREAYRPLLQTYLREHAVALCDSCRDRIDTNPLRVLDCKRPACAQIAASAPDIFGVMTPGSRHHFDEVQRLAALHGIVCERDRRLVRGLDYYNHTIFEFAAGALGAQDAILGGGRYDRLVEMLGGPSVPAVGFAAGVERLALLVSQQHQQTGVGVGVGVGVGSGARPDLYVMPLPDAQQQALGLAERLRDVGAWRIEVDLGGGRIKHQLRRADKLGARTALALGQDELNSGRARLKTLESSEETEVALDAASLHAALAVACKR